MKQTKWQRLATIGLCSSLVINAFSGVTAVAETITIESSPTVASSAKKATSASSATQASTESSQETTETSREEVTQETEKPEVVKEEQKEEPQAEVKQEETPANSSGNDLQKSISPRWVPNNQVIYPRMIFGFTDETGKAFADENLTLSGTYYKVVRNKSTLKWYTSNGTRYPIVSSNAGNGQYRVAVNAAVPLPYDFFTNVPAGYTLNLYVIEQLKVNNTLKYVDSIVAAPYSSITYTLYKAQQTSEAAQFGNYAKASLPQRDRTFSKSSTNIFSLNTALSTDTSELLTIMRVTHGNMSDPILIGFDGTATYQETLNYVVTRKQVTEKFVDANGVAITPPTGFTQNKKTPMTSNAFTFKQAGTLPEIYKASNGKTYQFKGWYKGKTKPNTLTTTKAPSYAVTYDDNDDLNVVYEEIEAFDFPALTYQFGFVDESGKRVDASTIDLTYDNWYGEAFVDNAEDTNISANWKTVSLEKGQVTPTKDNLKEIAYPAQPLEILRGRMSQYSVANLTFKIPKYYENISIYNKAGTFDTAYPFPTVKNNNSLTSVSDGPQLFQLKKSNNQSFIFNQTTGAAPADIQVPYYLRKMVYNPDLTTNRGVYFSIDKPIYYYLTNRKVTENFVNINGTKITPPTGFTQGNQIPMTSNTFKYTAARALPASYTTGGKTYIFQGWYKGKTKPNTLTTSTTPTYNTTFDGNDDMTAMYKEEVPKASVALTRTTAETVTSGGNVTWRATITNTSQAPLTTATIKKSTAWTTGLAAPTAMIVTPAGGTAKTVPVTATTWTNGVSLGTDIPVGKSATVQFTTKATGTAGQVLRAGITTSGNYSGVSASATVRVKDNDQAIVTPTAEGFISVPTFNFGQVGVAGSTQQHSLKKAADYYGNGTRNPYLRIKKTQANWSLTAQLSQPKSATDSLPTATRLLLGTAPVSSFSNYNQPTELKNAVGTTSAISLNANNTATRIIANQQFTGSNIYQLDFTFNNVKLQVPANQGVKGQQYQAAVTWNLVTGP